MPINAWKGIKSNKTDPIARKDIKERERKQEGIRETARKVGKDIFKKRR
jgi:hypothetical protein